MSATAAAVAPQPVRQTLELANGWRFFKGDVVGGAQASDYHDGSWARVSIPHTWNRVGYYKPSPQQHINRPDNINTYQGVGWYRLTFRPPELRARRAWLEFDAASRTAEVWLNGTKVGEHRGGFSRFRFDVTSELMPGRMNLLAVKVDNSEPKEGSSTADVLPLVGDFFVHGGLYRPVRLVLTDAVHIDMMDHGGPGIYASTIALDGQMAQVAVDAKLINSGVRPAHVSMRLSLVEAGGREAAGAAKRLQIRAGSGSEARLDLRLPHAHLWQGVSDPYLYVLRAEIRGEDGQLLDRLDQPFGVRMIRLDPEHGFFLNGHKLQLHGVGLHQDFEGKGWARSPQDVEQTIAIIREMGANTIRLTHYQHDQLTHDLADRYGLILWDEIPLVTAWTLGKAQVDPSPGLVANARQQLQELIRQNFNHASVAVWGIANEVDFGPRPPGPLRDAPVVAIDPSPMLRRLKALGRAEDGSRPIVLANCCEEQGTPGVPPVEDVVDANGANRYFGWYYGKPQDLRPHLRLLRSRRPWQPLALTEYGAGAATTVHTDNPLGGPVELTGLYQPEEYQSYVHEQNWRAIKDSPFLWATWLWNAFDFASTVRHEGDSEDLNTKGLVTYDRKIRKDAFYFYKANWTTTPTVHITGRRYVDRAFPVTDVRVYSNAPRTSLTVNGRPLGVRQNCPDHVCIWPEVALDEGSNILVASGQFGRHDLADHVTWQLSPDAARTIRIDSGALVAARSTSGRFGSDNFFAGGEAASADTRKRGAAAELAPITGSPDRDLLATYRKGDFHYRIPVRKGRYLVRLTFIEPSREATQRIFNVVANGRAVLSNFNVAAAAGAPLHAVQRQFEVDVPGGDLDLHFQPVAGDAVVNALEVSTAR